MGKIDIKGGSLSNDEVVNLIRDRVRAANSQSKFAAQLGISPQYLNDVLKGRREISAHLATRLGLKRIVLYSESNEGELDGDRREGLGEEADEFLRCATAPLHQVEAGG